MNLYKTIRLIGLSSSVAQQALIALAIIALAGTSVYTQSDARRDSIELQAARNKNVRERGKKVFYTRKFDLNQLPEYKPEQKLSGTIRIWGLNYLKDANLADYWEVGFRKYHPDIKIVWDLSSAM